MSTVLNTNGEKLEVPEVSPNVTEDFVIVTAEWNPKVTHALRDGAVNVLKEAGIADEKIKNIKVPGTVELVNVAGRYIEFGNPAAIIVIGCVIRGDTPHFDYVCHIVSTGVAILNAKGDVPVIFGVLTVDNQEQAEERAGGRLGNKGAEAAVAAIEMASIRNDYLSECKI